jgi:predicted permease
MVLVVTQVSVALMLLVGAGLLIRSFARQAAVHLGFEPAGVMTFEVNLPAIRYDSPERRVELHRDYAARLAALPGVEAVGATSWLPANGDYHVWAYTYPDAAAEPQTVAAQVRVIEGDYFSALGIPLLRGRGFGPEDRSGTEPTGIISASLAKKVYGEVDPVGQRFQISEEDHRIIGVAGDVATTTAGTGFDVVYLSHRQFAGNRNWSLTYVVKTGQPRADLIAAARRTLAQVDPALVLYQPRSLETVLDRHLARQRFVVLLMVAFGAIAVALAAVGIYGLLGYLVTQRRHELGIRMALGAAPGQVRRIVLRQALVVGGTGIVIGLAGALLLSNGLRSVATRVSARDPLVFGSATVMLLGVMLIAGYFPARRATRVDPLEALRQD